MNYLKLIALGLFVLAVAFGLNYFTGKIQPTSAQQALACNPPSQTVQVNQTATFTATGGTGTYGWGAQNATVSNPTGPTTTVTYTTPGTKSIFVASGNQTATCTVTVLSSTTTTPPLPSTGEKFGSN